MTVDPGIQLRAVRVFHSENENVWLQLFCRQRWKEAFMVQVIAPRLAVLVVEDEPWLRLSVVNIAEAEGFVVFQATNADQAIIVLQDNQAISIVATDIHMANSMDGLQLAMYAQRRWPPLRFIIVSGQSKPSPAEMPVGAIFLAKPYPEQDLRAALRGLRDPWAT